MSTMSITTDCGQQPARLYYLDWLRVMAILGVFLFYAVHPFDLTAWHITNAEQSVAVTFLSPSCFHGACRSSPCSRVPAASLPYAVAQPGSLPTSAFSACCSPSSVARSC
jgi:hypothetical protein